MGRGRGQKAAADDRLCVFPVFTDDVKRKNDTFHTEINKVIVKFHRVVYLCLCTYSTFECIYDCWIYRMASHQRLCLSFGVHCFTITCREGQLCASLPLCARPLGSDRCMQICAAALSPVGSELMRREVPAATWIKKEGVGGSSERSHNKLCALETQGRLLHCLTHWPGFTACFTVG